MPKVNKNGSIEPNKNEMSTLKDEKYNKAIHMMNCIGCMVTSKDKAEMYQQTAEQFIKMTGFQEADKYAEECKQLAKQTANDTKKKIYKNAQMKKNSAKLAEDFKVAADEFRKISNFKDSEELATQCDVLREKIEKKDFTVRISQLVMIMLGILVVIVFSTTSFAKYYYANACKTIGSYGFAIETYDKLGTYKDSPEKLTESRYLLGIEAVKDGDYATARKEFTTIGDYKDSESQKVEMQKQILLNSKVGDKIRIAGFNWIIVDTNDNKALLLKQTAIKNMPYNVTSEVTTWESSTLRQWLNSTFIKDNFSETEIKQIAQSSNVGEDNFVYGTIGGNTAVDFLFLLSVSDLEKYKDQLPKLKGNSWLRTPGNSLNSAVFLGTNGSVMNYGYDVSSKDMATYPCMWFDYK